MIKIGIAPRFQDFKNEAFNILDNWFNQITVRMNMASGANDPVLAEVPPNQWYIYKNTTLNEVRVWVNDGGTLKKSAAFT
jgi:hypothetical protein